MDFIQCNFHYIDTVQKKGTDCTGIITSIGWESDSDDEIVELNEDQVSVFWPESGTQSIENPLNLDVVERFMYRGDIVSKATDPIGLIGVVTKVYFFVDFEMRSGKTLFNVPGAFFIPTHLDLMDEFILYKNWVGKVLDVRLVVKVQVLGKQDTCILFDPEIEDFNASKLSSSYTTPFFVGQILSSKSSSIWKEGVWSGKRPSKKSKFQVVVNEVTYDSCEVAWYYSTDESTDPPVDIIQIKDITYLNAFNDTYLVLGNTGNLSSIDFEKYENQTDLEWDHPVVTHPESIVVDYVTSKNNAVKLSPPSANADNEGKIVKVKAFVDVKFEDGTIAEKIASSQLIERAFESYDLEVNAFVEKNSIESNELIGQLVKSNNVEKTCTVRWSNGVEEELSMYELKAAENLVPLYPGMYVLPPFGDPNKKGIGQVLEVDNDIAKILWFNNTISNEKVIECFSITEVLSDAEESENSFEENEEYYEEEYGSNVEEDDETDEEEEEDEVEVDSDAYNEDSFHDETPEPIVTLDDESIKKQCQFTVTTLETQEQLSQDSFFIVEDIPPTHKFISIKDGVFSKIYVDRIMQEWKQLSSSLPKGIWVCVFDERIDILSTLIEGPINTPYYLNFFFFDISVPPLSYPEKPPVVFFQSLTPRLHPNLYENGEVCLSLLGTWKGVESENWNSTRSSLLQLLISIQGLILGENKPFFLEAGYEKKRNTIEGEFAARSYNEKALLLSLQHMAIMVQSPPPGFELIVKDHFKQCYPTVLSMINAFLVAESNGTNAGQKIFDTSQFGVPLDQMPSKGFFKSLKEIQERLSAAFITLNFV